MTGRGAGYCAGGDRPGFANPIVGRGCGRGGGRGWRNWFYATGLPRWARGGYAPSASPDEAGALEAQAGFLKQALERIEKRLEELQGQDS